MTDFGWKLAATAAYMALGIQTAWGWRTGRISFGRLDGDRKASPISYWVVMGINTILVVGFLLGVLGVYGQYWN